MWTGALVKMWFSKCCRGFIIWNKHINCYLFMFNISFNFSLYTYCEYDTSGAPAASTLQPCWIKYPCPKWRPKWWRIVFKGRSCSAWVTKGASCKADSSSTHKKRRLGYKLAPVHTWFKCFFYSVRFT